MKTGKLLRSTHSFLHPSPFSETQPSVACKKLTLTIGTIATLHNGIIKTAQGSVSHYVYNELLVTH